MHLSIARLEIESKQSIHSTRNLLSIAFYIETQCICLSS